MADIPDRERGFEVDAMTPPHRTPVDVLVLLLRWDRVLLTRRAGEVYQSGYRAVPGGHVDAGAVGLLADLPRMNRCGSDTHPGERHMCHSAGR